MKKMWKKIKKFVQNNLLNVVLAIVSIIAFIIGGLAIGWLKSFLIVLVIDIILFGFPILQKKLKQKGKKPKTEKTKPEKKTKENAKTKRKNALKIFLIICFVIGTLLIIAVALFLFIVVKNAPEFDPENLYTKEASILYDSDGKIMAKLGAQKREKITYDEMPEVLINAIVATEDSRFFQHNGFDLPRFIKASLGQVTGNGAAGGASTITMQVAKNGYTSFDDKGIKGIIRKFTDIYLAMFKLEKKYSKEEILEFYVNSYFMGGGSWGVEQACLTYFGKSAKDINLSEAALIAGLFQSPNTYNPFNNPEAATKRRNTVLTLMVRHGYISEEEKEIAASIPVEDLLTEVSTADNEFLGFIDTVVAEVRDKTKLDPYVVPMEIYTTMDRKKQQFINDVMSGKKYAWENAKVDAGISVLNTKTGAIVAVGNGRNIKTPNGFKNAIDTKQQIGSTAKPLYDYGPGIEYNNWSTYKPWADEPHKYSDGKEVYNWDAQYQGLITSRVALSGSRNIPALKAFQSVANKNIKTFVTNLGLSPDYEGGTSIHEAHAIGGYNGESPLTVSAAYAAFANQGYYIKPYSYTKLVYRETGEVVENKSKKQKAMSEETAYMINDMLITTSKEALGGYSYVKGYTYAAKTGTTNFDDKTKEVKKLPQDAIRDLWVVGMTDEYSIGIWYGYDKIDKNYISHFGNSQHQKLFQTVAGGIFSRSTKVNMPSGVVKVTLEQGCVTDCLPSKYTPDNYKVTELFKKGTEPTEVSNRFDQLKNPTNLNSSYTNGVVSLTWDAITKPDAIDVDKMTTYFKKAYNSASLAASTAKNRVNANIKLLGNLGYDVYVKNADGTLTLIGTTQSNTIEHNITSTQNPITYVVKSAYSKFKSNASTGTEVTVKFDGSASIVTSQLVGDTNVVVNKNTVYTDQGKGVLVYDNMIDVTAQATITVTVKDASGNKIGNSIGSINFSVEGEYSVDYTIKYKTYTKVLTRTITIQ